MPIDARADSNCVGPVAFWALLAFTSTMELLAQLFDEIASAVAGQPTQAELRKLRDRCDSQAIRRAAREILRSLNHTETRDQVLDHHKRLLRAIEEKVEQTRERKDQAKLIGIGMGSAVTGGGIIAAISIAVPVVAVIPILGGAYCLWRGSENAKFLAAEQTLYEQLREAVRQLVPDDA